MENKNRSNIDETVAYYENNASTFIESTINADVSSLYKDFEKLINPGCKILDLGCGSGRDSRYFVRRGYSVVAVDPSPVMCAHTRAMVDIPVFEMKAEDMQFPNEFDAVWACASLLHVSREKQIDVFRLICKALKNDGIFYCSWKYGNDDRSVDGRHFTDLTEDFLTDLLKKMPVFEEEKVWITHDVRKDKQNQKWLNALIKKVADV